MKRLVFSLLATLLLGLGLASTAMAGSLSVQGLAVTPDISQITLEKDQPSVTYSIRLDNNLTTPITVSVTSLDFKSLNESGGLFFVGTGVTSLEHTNSLARWIVLPTTPITLPPESGQLINVTIENRADLSPGGHYAAVVFSVLNKSASGTNNVKLNQQISSLLFVRKGSGQYSVAVSKSTLNNGLFKWPSSLALTFTNTGNTQTAPVGYVNLNGQHTLINENSNLVLPGSSRKLVVNLAKGAGFWPGHYQASVSYRPDATSTFSNYSVSFFYINPWFVIFCLVVLLVLFSTYAPARRMLVWLLLKLDKQIRRLEIYSTHFARPMRHPRRLGHSLGRVLVWLGLKADRQLRRIEIWVTKLIRLWGKR